MAGVTLSGVHKIYQGTEPIPRKWWEVWKPSRRPNEVHVVKGCDLEIRDGEFLVLVGPSGCGKSTTLRMVAGLEEVTRGEIRIGERVVNDVSPKDRDIAMVFQSYALYPHMTVAENMSFGLKLRKYPPTEIADRVKEAAGLLDIGHLLERRPKELSGGQRQRVAMGRAIVRRPQVFLMDEPLSNLDAKLRVQMRAELQRLHHKLGVTTIYVTHDQTEAMTLGDRIVLMNNGHIQQCDSPLQLYNRPANLFVAGFIGSPGMNFFKVRGEDGFAVHPLFRMKLPEEAAGAGGELTLGVRPQHLTLTPAQDPAVMVPAELEVVEPLGSENFFFCRLAEGGEQVTLRTESAARREVGDRLELCLDPRFVHVFGADGEALAHPRGEENSSK
ncbi:MAG: sn-glycerol-3-phosphate ABC transporter ATP-binding protein UgpC [Vulcanimicrobiota bacterium]